MKLTVTTIVLLFSAIFWGFGQNPNNSTGSDPALMAKANGFMQNISKGFEENKGQVTGLDASRVKFMLKDNNLSLFLLNDGIAYQFNRILYPKGYTNSNKFASVEEQQKMEELSKDIRVESYRMDIQLVGANQNPSITTEGKTDNYVQYYNHNALNVHNYTKVTYHNVYPNIDWVIYSKAGQTKYDFVVHPGGNPDQIKLKTNWVEDLKLNADGSLSMKNRMGEITEKSPVSFQNMKQVETQFEVLNGIIGFNIENYSKNELLVIDPALIWATYYGSSGNEESWSCDTDALGNVFLAGYTNSSTNIAVGGYQTSIGGGNDGYLVKFNSAGVLQWSTYYGGTGNDDGRSVGIDSAGDVYLSGHTTSTANIAFGGHQSTLAGFIDLYIVKFNTNGVRIWASYYGGTLSENGSFNALGFDGVGNVYFTGRTPSSSGIAFSGHQNTFGGSNDAFLVKFNSTGTLQWATYYGGTEYDDGRSCSVDAAGNVYLAGVTQSPASIASGGHQNSFAGQNDGFLVKFNSSGVRQWATYYGGIGVDDAMACATDNSDNIYLVGNAQSTADIAVGGHQNSFAGGTSDAFLVKFNGSGVRQWASYYGGVGNDVGNALAVDASNNIFIVGSTASSSGISSNGFQNLPSGGADAFLVKFNSSGIRQWGTYYGAIQNEDGYSCAIDVTGNVYLAGRTANTTNIAYNGHDNSYGGGTWDGFLAKFDGVCIVVAAPTGSASQSICNSGTIANINVTGSNILWYSASSGGTLLATNTPLNSATTYYATQTISGCESLSRLGVTITINIPTTPTGSATQTFCSTATVSSLVATGTAIQWYSSPSGGTALAVGTPLANNTNYYASQTISGCESANRLEVLVNIVSCENSLHFDGANDRVDLPTSAHTPITTSGTIEAWIKTSNAGASLRGIVTREFHYGIFLNNNQLMSYNWTGSGTTGATTYTGVSLNDNQWHHVAMTFQNGVTNGSQLYIDGQPVGSPFTHFEAATAANFRIGTNGLTGQFFQGQIDNVKIWARVLSPTELINTYNCIAIGTTNLNAHYMFNEGLASQTNTGITTLPAVNNSSNNGTLFNFALTGSTSNWVAGYSCTPNLCPTPTGTASQTLCSGSTVADLVATGQNIQWYSTSTGGTALNPSTSLVNGTVYYATQTTVDCESASRFAVTVTLNAIPSAPTGSAAQTTCGGTLANLTATGTNIQWYVAATGGSPLASNTPLVNGNTYYASQTVNGCQSTSRLAVTVTSETPPPTGASTQEYCSPSTLNSLPANVTGSNLLYYAAPTGGSALPFNTPMVNGTTYYVSQTVNGCQSVSRLAVTTTVYTFTSNMTAANPQQFCNSATVANLVVNATPGATISWFTSSMGWQSGQSPLTSITQLVNNTTYYAGQSFGTNNLCKYVGTAGVLVVLNSTAAPTGSASQTFCNSATVANLTATGTAIQWYTTSTGGSALPAGTALTSGTTYYASQTISGCESVNRFAVSVTINVPSTPTGAATQTVCSGAIVGDLAATGTGIQWYAASTGGTALSAGTALVNGTTYYASQTISGCESASRLAVNVVFGIPSAPTGSAAQTFCNSATVANLVASGSNIQWYTTSTGGTVLSSGTALTNGSTYYASQTSGGCESTTRLAVTVTINTPAAPTGTASQTFCNSGTVANLSATGSGILWYAASTGGTALSTGTALVNGTTYYASQTLTGCESINRFAVTAIINTQAAPTGAAAQTFCNSGTVANLTATGTAIQWYAASTGGTALSAGTTLVNGTTYYASQTVSSCESATRFAVTVTINVPSAPTGTASQTVCSGAIVGDLSATGSNIQWYAAPSGGSPLLTSTALTNGTTYYASQTVTGCESVTRFAVNVVFGIPSAPTGSAAQTFCNSATIANLVASGSNLQWYTTSTGGTALSSGTALSNATTYYASQTSGGCESTNRLAVTVTINAPAAPTGTASQTFCNSGTVANLSATGSGILWYAASTGGTALTSGTALSNGTYYASQTLSGCESATRLAVAVTINAPAAPTGATSQTICGAGTLADLTISGTGITWYDAATAGNVLTPTIALVNGTTYYATQTISGCESLNQLAVTASINAIPSAPVGTASQEFCNSATISDLSATGTVINWYTDAVSTTPLNGTTALSNGATYYATQTLNGCESTDRLAVAVTINTTAAPTGSTTQSFCSASIVDDLSATGTSITWYTSATGGTALAGLTSLSNGTYYASQTINGCESANRLAVAVTVTILDANVSVSGVTLTAAQAGATYTWVDCNNGNQPISGANGQSYTATANGSYAVEIELNGCVAVSNCEVITSVGLEEDKTLVLGVQPNPTFGVLNISVSYPTSAVITASNGTVVKTLALEGVKTIDVSSFATGVYYIRTSEGQTVKFIKE
jgi:uncharacterized membrane protein